ncbi:hypothetical protein UY3_02383 [Chelonia mydas]|uniref:Uncharacterized protein n=1 Tax=Chelonia mydas TaxID=8469 RepID=M7CHK1_CHEMY|nr:hypothetical protein UY3_02383 [Chelonia mydas]
MGCPSKPLTDPSPCRLQELDAILGSDLTFPVKSPMDTSAGLETADSGLNPEDEVMDEEIKLKMMWSPQQSRLVVQINSEQVERFGGVAELSKGAGQGQTSALQGRGNPCVQLEGDEDEDMPPEEAPIRVIQKHLQGREEALHKAYVDSLDIMLRSLLTETLTTDKLQHLLEAPFKIFTHLVALRVFGSGGLHALRVLSGILAAGAFSAAKDPEHRPEKHLRRRCIRILDSIACKKLQSP